MKRIFDHSSDNTQIYNKNSTFPHHDMDSNCCHHHYHHHLSAIVIIYSISVNARTINGDLPTYFLSHAVHEVSVPPIHAHCAV